MLHHQRMTSSRASRAYSVPTKGCNNVLQNVWKDISTQLNSISILNVGKLVNLSRIVVDSWKAHSQYFQHPKHWTHRKYNWSFTVETFDNKVIKIEDKKEQDHVLEDDHNLIIWDILLTTLTSHPSQHCHTCGRSIDLLYVQIRHCINV
jgi:hypothetical protein